ncbi:MAG: hypothetical protein HOO91_11310 [Bacteroidales bacterium]|nr:hypothetical protein [Bacteroidales bacterium]
MKVLFCSPAINALGETYTIANFALELMNKGHECYFLAPLLGKRYLLTFGFSEHLILVLKGSIKEDKELLKNNKVIFDAFLDKVSPDFVIVADWHEFKPNGNSNNNSYNIHWFNDKIKLGTFDHFGFAPKGIKLDLFINGYKTDKLIPPTNQFSFIIRPCPHHNNLKKNEDKIFYWAIIKDKFDYSTTHKEGFRKYSDSHNIQIFHPIGLWQERAIDKIFLNSKINKDYYADIFLPIMFNYLTDLNEEISYIVISGKVKQETKTKYRNINITWKPPIGNSEFMQHLFASDILITDNLMSSNIGKAAYGNVIPIVFTNSMTFDKKNNLHCNFELTDNIREKISVLVDHKLLFPYKAFPMGLNEIEEMYDNNPFTSCFIMLELFDEVSSKELFYKLIKEKSLSEEIQSKQKQYVEFNKKLLTAEEILMQL